MPPGQPGVSGPVVERYKATGYAPLLPAFPRATSRRTPRGARRPVILGAWGGQSRDVRNVVSTAAWSEDQALPRWSGTAVGVPSTRALESVTRSGPA